MRYVKVWKNMYIWIKNISFNGFLYTERKRKSCKYLHYIFILYCISKEFLLSLDKIIIIIQWMLRCRRVSLSIRISKDHLFYSIIITHLRVSSRSGQVPSTRDRDSRLRLITYKINLRLYLNDSKRKRWRAKIAFSYNLNKFCRAAGAISCREIYEF